MRKQHPSASKAKIVTEAIKEEKTISQIASENGIHPTQISQWKSLALTGLPTLFERHSKAQIAHEAQTEELYAQIGKLTTQVAWLKKNLVSSLSREKRIALVEREGSDFSLKEQANLLSLSRSSLYYTPRLPSAEEVAIKHRIAVTLREEESKIGRNTERAYMRDMGLEAIYPKPNLSAPNLEHRIYPYLLRGVKASHPDHLWGIDITYIRLTQG